MPMCGCDIGFNCGTKAEETVDTHMTGGDLAGSDFESAMKGAGKSCTAVTPAQCEVTSGTSYDKTCLKCGTSSTYDCEECCAGCTQVTKALSGTTYKWCECGKKPSPSPSPGPQPHDGYFSQYPNTHFRPGQTNELCPTGVQFPTLWDGGAGAGNIGGFGRFMFTMVDRLQVPQVPAGEYSVSWRWDCEETPQVWNSCADINIIA